MSTRFYTKRKFWLFAALGLFAFLCIAAWVGSFALEPWARRRVIALVEQRFGSSAELEHLYINLFPGVHISGSNLKLRHKKRTDVPPIISIERFEADTGYLWLLMPTRKIRQITLSKLLIQVPPRAKKSGPRQPEDDRPPTEEKKASPIEVETVIADGTRLLILPRDQGREPLEWNLYKLRLQSIRTDDAMAFTATLRNGKPPGLIETKGKFGPWEREDPGYTNVSGDYVFRQADLSVFKGIRGTLASNGNYRGRLNRIAVDGTTDTPDFALDYAQNPVPLKTKFSAVVDGMNGDTYLRPVDAQLGQTKIVAAGSIAGKVGQRGKTVFLNLSIEPGRIEDILRLAIKGSETPMTGRLRMKTLFELPPGEPDVMQRLRLNGNFAIEAAKLTKTDLRKKLEGLSNRTKGKPGAETGQGTVLTGTAGKFTLGSGSLNLRDFAFGMPGATLLLEGNYGLRNEQIAMEGLVATEATVSQMIGGWKSVLLKPVDPFFRKRGKGAILPIRISGSRSDPSFGLRLRGDKKLDTRPIPEITPSGVLRRPPAKPK